MVPASNEFHLYYFFVRLFSFTIGVVDILYWKGLYDIIDCLPDEQFWYIMHCAVDFMNSLYLYSSQVATIFHFGRGHRWALVRGLLPFHGQRPERNLPRHQGLLL